MIVSSSRNRSDSDNEDDPPPPAMPTGFWCGTQEKVDVMRDRIEAGEAVFHPDDCSRYVPKHLDEWDKRKPWE